MPVNQDSAINYLISRRIITRTEVRGRYYIRDCGNSTFRRDEILSRFATQPVPGRYIINRTEVARATLATGSQPQQPQPEQPRLRTLSRSSYHSQSRNVEEALARITPDEDGVTRSFGIEYEIYQLTAEQEDKLANLLDTLPAHVVERDASLGSTGCEIVFEPVGKADYINIVNTLANFVRENNVCMQSDDYSMAGMHTTYGVSNYRAEKSDLQIRLNRFALAVKSVGTQGAIKSLFGRDFGHYRELPTSTTYNTHGNAFSTNGRPRSCWECRLTAWNCNPARMVEFFKATEVAFYRPVQASDFIKVFEALGSNTEGC